MLDKSLNHSLNLAHKKFCNIFVQKDLHWKRMQKNAANRSAGENGNKVEKFFSFFIDSLNAIL